MTAPLITRVQPLRPRGLKVVVHLDVGEPLEITLEALERSRLGVGDLLPPDRRKRLLDEDADIRVREAALNQISYRARTRVELQRKLRKKGFEPARIESCLSWLEERGFLDDRAVAAAFIRDRLRHRPRGRAALTSELRAKGVGGEVIGSALDEVFETEGTDDVALARSVAEMWVARQPASLLEALARTDHAPERDKARRRLMGYLTRRGFRSEALSTGMAHAIDVTRDRVT